MDAPNELTLWSWESNDDLRFVDAPVRIAKYQGTIILGRNTARLMRRRNTLRMPPQAIHFPVYRIELAHTDEPATQDAFMVAKEIILAELKRQAAPNLQIDFDAKQNDRPAYLRFLNDLRKAIPKDCKLSITALASWCLKDKWLQSASIDETVAMLFSMGKGKSEALSALANTPLNSGGSSTQAIGISINEETANARIKQMGFLSVSKFPIYAFSSTGWTKERYEKLLNLVDGNLRSNRQKPIRRSSQESYEQRKTVGEKKL